MELPTRLELATSHRHGTENPAARTTLHSAVHLERKPGKLTRQVEKSAQGGIQTLNNRRVETVPVSEGLSGVRFYSLSYSSIRDPQAASCFAVGGVLDEALKLCSRWPCDLGCVAGLRGAASARSASTIYHRAAITLFFRFLFLLFSAESRCLAMTVWT